jgi:hypothetical protein
MARKNEKVAALLSIYWDRVARKPRGPAPWLVRGFSHESIEEIAEAYRIMLQDPKINPMVSPTPPPIRAPILGFQSLVFVTTYEM